MRTIRFVMRAFRFVMRTIRFAMRDNNNETFSGRIKKYLMRNNNKYSRIINILAVPGVARDFLKIEFWRIFYSNL